MSLRGFGGGNNTIDDLNYMSFKEDYAAGTVYDEKDVVVYAGGWYICLISCRGVTPTDADYWRPVTAIASSENNSASVTAAESLSGHRVVTFAGYYASKDTVSDAFKVLGVTQGAAAAGDAATATTYGVIANAGWNWTLGSPVFLSTAGGLTQTPPTTGFRIIIGHPQTATTLFVTISEPIIL